MRPKKEVPKIKVERLLKKYGNDYRVSTQTGASIFIFRISRNKHKIPAGSTKGRKPFKLGKTKLKRLTRRFSVSDVADILGVTSTTIYNYLRIYDIDLPRRKKVVIGKTNLRRKLRSYSVKEVADMYNVSRPTIYKYIREYELKR